MASTEAVFKSLRRDFKRNLSAAHDSLEDYEHKTNDINISLDSASTQTSFLST
jgi:hypothetical protein